MDFILTTFLYIFYCHLMHTNFANLIELNYNSEEYLCDNFYHADEFVPPNFYKCYCEPYDEANLDGKPSIVRFPVNTNILISVIIDNFNFIL